MAVVSKPVSYGLCFAIVIGGIYYFQPDAPASKKGNAPAKRRAAATTEVATDFRPEDFTQRFARLKTKPRNMFHAPEIGLSKAEFAALHGNIIKVPAVLADGDPNWIFTGIAIVDDKKMALLENSSKHLAEYATEGQPWKASKVRRVSADGIALVPKDGGEEQVVLRYNPTLDLAALPPVTAAPPPGQGNQPVVPPMVGPIGNNLQIRPQRGRGLPMIINGAAVGGG